MTIFTIPLKQLIFSPESHYDLVGREEPELLALLEPAYAFLGPDAGIEVRHGQLHITLPDVSAYQQDRAQQAYARAVKLAERGAYDRAIRLFTEALETLPAYVDARRNLAMACLESGDPEGARQLLVETLRLDPTDTWAYVLLGNLAMQQDKDAAKAERLYEKAVTLSPEDHIVITNYAALLAQRGETEQADALFLKAIRIDSSYPNAYYALAKMAHDVGDVQRAVNVLDNMFDVATGPTVRNQPFFDEARRLYLTATIVVAEAAYDELMALVEQRAAEIETLTGYPTRLEHDASLQLPATARVAWAYGEDAHLLRYRGEDRASTPHLLMHELEHIAMEAEAREAAQNRTFTATQESDRKAHAAIAGHVARLRREGVSEAFLDQWNAQSIHIIRSQLYNLPLDMIIEQRLLERYESLRPS